MHHTIQKTAKMQLLSTLALASSASALVAPVAPKASVALKGATLDDQLKKIPGVSPLKNAPADYGFDPLGFAKVSYPRFGLPESELLRTNNLRDAELRHGRLAMLAAAAWPIQELVHPSLAKLAGAPAFLLATAAAIGYLDVQAEAKKAQVAPEDWIPGYYGFDPLNIVRGMSPLAVKNMQAKEINNGRLAMVAVVAYVVQEAMTGEPVTSVSEQFFTPIIYYPWVQH